MAKNRGILLDLDNTLYDYKRAHTAALNKTFEYLNNKFCLESTVLTQQYESAKQRVKNNLKKTAASHNRLLYFQIMLEQLEIHPASNALYLYNLYWDTFLENMKPFENMMTFLKNSHKTHKICLITDLTAHIQYRKIARLKIDIYLDYIVTSEEVGKEKPHPDIFNYAIEKIGCKKENICMIGDNYEKDILGASQLDIDSFWFEAKKQNLTPYLTSYLIYGLASGLISGRLCKKFNNFNMLKAFFYEKN